VFNEPSTCFNRTFETNIDAIAHRGPDGDFWLNENKTVGFGHRRLAIIEDPAVNSRCIFLFLQAKHADNLAKGPRKGVESITYNGEIYDYPELKKS
jgi:asparagine synthetase B (glutamine-hydrolysing)